MIHERARRVQAGAFWQLLGMAVQVAEDGRSRVTLGVRDELRQLYGVLHGGVLASLVDGAVGVAVQSTLAEGEETTTIDLQVMYDQPARAGELTAEAELLRRGRTVIFGRCEVRDAAGELVAHGSATYLVKRPRR